MGLAYNKQKHAEETARHKWVFIATIVFNIAVNDSDGRKSTHCSWVLVVTELIVSGTQCILPDWDMDTDLSQSLCNVNSLA